MPEPSQQLKNSIFLHSWRKQKKFLPILFFSGGFIFDSLTLGRIDRLYDLFMLSLHMTSLTVALYLFNRVEDGRWKDTILGRFESYFPLAIQFFFGALSSAYVIYFSRSVSLSKTATFFFVLVILLVANEFLKKRISNKYLQFGLYSFVSFTFFAFMIPVFIKVVSTGVFIVSGLVSFSITFFLVSTIYKTSPNTREETSKRKLVATVTAVYGAISLFYFLRLIPPVPLALDAGMVAHDISRDDGKYVVTYEPDEWYVFWRKYSLKFNRYPDEKVYIFSSIFAPTDIKKSIYHRWQWYNPRQEVWETVEDIGYEMTGGREDGFRGYTYKRNVKAGEWRVEVITDEELVLGVVSFEIINSAASSSRLMVSSKF